MKKDYLTFEEAGKAEGQHKEKMEEMRARIQKVIEKLNAEGHECKLSDDGNTFVVSIPGREMHFMKFGNFPIVNEKGEHADQPIEKVIEASVLHPGENLYKIFHPEK
jgi:hypothetical protein